MVHSVSPVAILDYVGMYSLLNLSNSNAKNCNVPWRIRYTLGVPASLSGILVTVVFDSIKRRLQTLLSSEENLESLNSPQYVEAL